MSADQLSRMYSASSDHQLLDQLVECNGCGFAYLNPRPNANLIISGYESAVDPAFVAQNSERIATFGRTLSSILHQTGLTAAGKRLLDVGCAGGAFPKAARDAGFEVTGIEPSHWLAEFGRKEYGLNVRQGLLERGTFPPSSFDVISLWDVIEHVPDPNGLLAVIHENLTPEGYLIVNFPDYGSWPARLLGRRWPFLLSVHLLYYTRTTMRRQLEQAGFSVLNMQPHWQALKLGYVLHRAAAWVKPAGWLVPVVKGLGLANLPFTYNVGQTLVIARKKPR
jgi:SAM-dependent methyltransferase